MPLKLRRFWPILFVIPAVVLILVFRSCVSEQKVQPKIGRMVESVYGIGTVTARHTYQLNWALWTPFAGSISIRVPR